MHPIQKLMNNMSKGWRAERSLNQMTLAGLIDEFEKLDSDRKIVGLGEPDSYRGYYSDLAFNPSDEIRTVNDLLGDCKLALGTTYTGYKGGDFFMDEHTPLWISDYGMSSGKKLMGLNLSEETIVPVIELDDQ